MQAGPYTEDFDFALFDTPIPQAFIIKCIFLSASQTGLKSLEDHCAVESPNHHHYREKGIRFTNLNIKQMFISIN